MLELLYKGVSTKTQTVLLGNGALELGRGGWRDGVLSHLAICLCASSPVHIRRLCCVGKGRFSVSILTAQHVGQWKTVLQRRWIMWFSSLKIIKKRIVHLGPWDETVSSLYRGLGIQLPDGKGSAQSHRDTRDCELLQDPETEPLNSSIFCFITSKPFLLLRPYLCWRNPLWRWPYPGYTCSDRAPVHDEWRVPPRALGRGTNHVPMPVGHTFHTSTSPVSPSRWGSSARAWRLLKSSNCSHAHSSCHLPSRPPGLQVLATPQCLHLKHLFRLWRKTGEKWLHTRTRDSQKMSIKRAETVSFLYTLYSQGCAWGLAEEHSGKHFLVGWMLFFTLGPPWSWTMVKTNSPCYNRGPS